MTTRVWVTVSHVYAGWFLCVAMEAAVKNEAWAAFASVALFFLSMIVGHVIDERRHPSQAAERAA